MPFNVSSIARGLATVASHLKHALSTIRARRAAVLYTGAAVVSLIVLVALLSPLVGSLVTNWSRSDIELRARIIFSSVRSRTIEALQDSSRTSGERLKLLLERITTDERLAGIALCDSLGTTRIITEGTPEGINCWSVPRGANETTSELRAEGRHLLVSALPLPEESGGHLLVAHDLAYAQVRANEAQTYLIMALVAMGLLAAGAATFVALILLRNWQRTLRGTIADLRAGRTGLVQVESLGKELREALDQYDLTRRTLDGIHVDWSPDTLKQALLTELPNSQVIVVSNREPYIHNRDDTGTIKVQVPASGLVAALEPVIRACGGTWIAHGSGSADRDTVDANDRLNVPPNDPAYTLRRIWLSQEEQDGYYYGLANEGLWPLSHIAFIRPNFRESDWRAYKAVNAKFADALVKEARCPDPVVLVQDYHFALLPKLIRQRLPNATIISFWHIPWPNAETFGICPWKEEIVEGLLGSSILGFHTHFHCNNFLETVDRYVESRIDREWRSVVHCGHETLIRPYPISIEWPPAALSAQESIEECRRAVRARHGLAPDIKLGVGIERFDYTKGILDRIRAVDSLLRRHPEWRGRFTFLQAAAPSRSRLPAYNALQAEAKALVEEVNARYGTEKWRPIILAIRHHEPHEVYELYRAADHCVVSSLHDGMNLVAKEFVAARDDELGVLILSTFAGASRELSEALIVNPYHTRDMSETMHRALTMSPDEQHARMRQMRALVRTRNVYCWAGQMILDAAQLRRRHDIQAIATANAAQKARGIATSRKISQL
jgi:trehalose 6-phosphate synthase